MSSIPLLMPPRIAGLLPATVVASPDHHPVIASEYRQWSEHRLPTVAYPPRSIRQQASRLLPTPEEIDLDIARTFQRCYARLQKVATPSVIVEG